METSLFSGLIYLGITITYLDLLWMKSSLKISYSPKVLKGTVTINLLFALSILFSIIASGCKFSGYPTLILLKSFKVTCFLFPYSS